MQQSRERGEAAVLARGVCAGTIESSKGSASDAPTPRRMVRRDRCFLVRNIPFILLLIGVPVHLGARSGWHRRPAIRRPRPFASGTACSGLFPERKLKNDCCCSPLPAQSSVPSACRDNRLPDQARKPADFP